MTAAVIRDLRPGDEAQLLAINQAAAPGVSLLSPEELPELIRLSVRFRVAEADGELVAYLVAFAEDAGYDADEFRWFQERFRGRFLYIDQVAVAPAWRDRGIGRQMYRDLEGWALPSGIEWLTCEVNLRPPNPGSLRFHEREGFAEVGTLETGDGRFVSLRVKDLSARTE